MKTDLELKKFYNVEFGKTYKIINSRGVDWFDMVGRTFQLERRQNEKHGKLCLKADSGAYWQLSFLDEYDYIQVNSHLSLLTPKEKEYLSNVIKPFRDRVTIISKFSSLTGKGEAIKILVKRDNYSSEFPYEIFDPIYLPYFKAGTMYRMLIEDKNYKPEELGL